MTRLDKFVASALQISRKEAKALIKTGRIGVDGECADENQQFSPSSKIFLDERELFLKTEAHIMLNKPSGVICAARDPKQKTVMDLLPKELTFLNIQPIGRLDKDVTGLLLLSSDGDLNHRLCSPKYEIQKCYEAAVQGFLHENAVEIMQNGIEFKDFTSKPARLEILKQGETQSLARLYISEGKFHQVKKMFSHVGNEVIKLKRISLCGIPLDESLKEGEFRELSDFELKTLRKAVKLDE